MKNTLIAAVTVSLCAFMLAACDVAVDKDQGAAKPVQMTTYDTEIAAVKTWIEIWDSAEVNKLDAIAHSDFKRTAPDVNANSLDELGAFILQVHETYPDFNITNDGMAAGPDGVFVQWTVTGTDSGPGENATGRPIRVTGISRYRLSEGKIASELVIFDTGFAATQLGATEMPHADN